jgi:hypothetical protein
MAEALTHDTAEIGAGEYIRKAEDCLVQAERSSGDRKSKWLELAERWKAAATKSEVSGAAVEAKRSKNTFALEVDRRQEPRMQGIASPNLSPLFPPDQTPRPIRKRRSGTIACGIFALALGLAGGVSLHGSDLDPSAAWLQQTGSALQSRFSATPRKVASVLERFTSRPVSSVEQTQDVAGWKPSPEAVVERAVSDLSLRVDQVRAANEGEAREVVLAVASIRTAAEQYQKDILGKLAQLEGRLDRIERQSDLRVASPTPKPVVQSPPQGSKPAAQLPEPSRTQLISKPVRQAALFAKDNARVKETSKDSKPGNDSRTVANWSLQDVSDEVAVLKRPRGVVQVEVGDDLPGVGRVLAIMHSGRGWVVATPKGWITH